jgi:putative cell wall-binding protein
VNELFLRPFRVLDLRRTLAFASVLVALLLLPAAPASAGWRADYVEGNASGQAVYEDMVIHPEAVRSGSTVYIAFQGFGLAPCVAAIPDAGAVVGPYRVGPDPLVGSADPNDSHGAPALLTDATNGRLSIFWGAHGSDWLEAAAPLTDISTWTTQTAPFGLVTYPQVFTDDTGVTHMFFRGHGARLNAAVLANNGWWHAISADGGLTWTSPVPVLASTPLTNWYVHFEPGTGGVVHMITVTQDGTTPNPLARTGVYYAWLDPASGRWKDAAGDLVGTAGAPLTLAILSSPGNDCSVPVGPDAWQDGGVAADDGTGHAGLIFVSGGAQYGPDKLRWVFARWDGAAWMTSTIARTDFLMDSGTIEYADSGIDAYLTVGAPAGYVPADPYDYRGGDIVLFHSGDNGATWQRTRTIAVADRDRGVLYNDPQIVQSHDATGPRLLFSEWDNDPGAPGHKVYLWSPTSGFVGRDFSTSVARLSGPTRYDVAAAISRTGFPNGSQTVVIASGEAGTDALAGASLAAADKAPLLLVSSRGVPAAVAAELARLSVTKVIVLGGTGSVSNAVMKSLRRGRVTSVTRVWGPDRYSTAAAVAAKVVAATGRRRVAFVASGDAPADGLAASAVAAARGAPLLLVRRTSAPAVTLRELASLGVTRTIVAGGPATISDPVVASLPGGHRVSGADRYSTAAALAVLGLDGEAGVCAPSTRADRFLIAAGSASADALAAAPLAARLHAPLLLTDGSVLSTPTAEILSARGGTTLQCWVAGGDATVLPSVFTQIGSLLGAP